MFNSKQHPFAPALAVGWLQREAGRLPSRLLGGCGPTVRLRQEMVPLLTPKRLQAWTSQVALVVKILPASARDTGDAGSIPGSGRFPGVGNGTLLQYSCLGNFMGRGALWATVHGVGKSWTQLSGQSKPLASL